MKHYIKEKIRKIQIKLTDTDKKLQKIEENFPKVMTTSETLKMIKNENMSLVRFGDGEFNLIAGKNIAFQKHSKKIESKLKECLQEDNNKILVSIPSFTTKYNNVENIIGKYDFWQVYWFFNYSKIKKYFNPKRNYGNAFVSRLDVFFENDLENIQQIWKDRNIVYIYSKSGRFDKNSKIFNNISNAKEILINEVNAFELYDHTLEQCLKYDKQTLFLVSAGPMATILCCDLANRGYQALDIGHLPNTYEQYLGNIASPESLPISKSINKKRK